MSFLNIKTASISFFIATLLLSPIISHGQFWKKKTGVLRNKIEEEHLVIQDLTIDENTAIPVIISPFAGKKTKEFMAAEVKRLQKIKNIAVKTIRKEEIIKAVIPMDILFLPNDTTLWNRAEYTLRSFARYTNRPDMFHLLIVTHSDGTGGVDYNLNLTTKRAKAIMKWFGDNGADTKYIVTYGMGSEEPLDKNNSEVNRRKNRRTEIYIIPAEVFIKQAEKGKVSL